MRRISTIAALPFPDDRGSEADAEKDDLRYPEPPAHPGAHGT